MENRHRPDDGFPHRHAHCARTLLRRPQPGSLKRCTPRRAFAAPAPHRAGNGQTPAAISPGRTVAGGHLTTHARRSTGRSVTILGPDPHTLPGPRFTSNVGNEAAAGANSTPASGALVPRSRPRGCTRTRPPLVCRSREMVMQRNAISWQPAVHGRVGHADPRYHPSIRIPVKPESAPLRINSMGSAPLRIKPVWHVPCFTGNPSNGLPPRSSPRTGLALPGCDDHRRRVESSSSAPEANPSCGRRRFA